MNSLMDQHTFKTPSLRIIKWLLILFGLLITVHLMVMSFYIERHNIISKEIKEIQPKKIVSFISQSGNHLSSEQLKTIVQVLPNLKLQYHHYTIKLSASKEPEWQQRIENAEITKNHVPNSDQINHAFTFSYPLSNGMWLNYEAVENYSYYGILAILFLLELLLLAIVVFYSWSVLSFTIPLRNFKDSAEKLGIDINHAIAQTSGPTIVQETVRAMNKMQERLQEFVNTRTKMLAAISHDLRTPITRLKLRAQLLDNDQQATKINSDLEEMELMISGMLSFARNDTLQEKKISFDLNTLLKNICIDHQQMGHPVEYSGLSRPLPFWGRPLAFKRLFNNLIQNAIKYGGNADVYLRVSTGQIILLIEDDGPGIPEEELSLVFKAYYRSKKVSANNSTGTGLGLTIVSEVVKAHDGTIELVNRKEGGLAAVLNLPYEVEKYTAQFNF